MTESVFTYIRTSTSKQADAATHRTQRQSIYQYIAELDVRVIAEFQDDAKSGASTENRDGYNEMMGRLSEVDGIVVYAVDRLTRDFREGADLAFRLKESGKKLYISSNKSVISVSDDWDVFMQIVRALGASEERMHIKRRQMDGIKRRIAEKGYWGKPKAPVDWERYNICKQLGMSNEQTAVVLGISRRTLSRRLKDRANGESDNVNGVG